LISKKLIKKYIKKLKTNKPKAKAKAVLVNHVDTSRPSPTENAATKASTDMMHVRRGEHG
jgi:hypothetical protein